MVDPLEVGRERKCARGVIRRIGGQHIIPLNGAKIDIVPIPEVTIRREINVIIPIGGVCSRDPEILYGPRHRQ